MMIVFWTLDVLHPSVLAIIPIAISCILDGLGKSFISEMYVRNDLLDCFGVLIIVIAVENCNVHKRLALKVLLVFGCSHYRLSFLLFFTSTFLSMWVSNTLACGLMMPIVKAILLELEKMGILEMYQTVGKAQQISTRHEQNVPRPSDITVFYYLGIAYSSSIGDMATMMGSQTNQLFKIYCETIFPAGPKIEFPHFMLLNLPGVLVMETLLYLWMNFNFLGMFRNRSTIEVAMTEEETQYMNTLLATQYQQMGKVQFHEFVVASIAVLACLLQATISTAHIDQAIHSSTEFHNHFRVSSPCLICVTILFLMPTKLDFMKYFKKNAEGNNDPLPSTQSKSCLNWNMVHTEMEWSVLLITAGSSTLFESLKDSGMHAEFESFLLLFEGWPPYALVFIIVVFCKILTEFASNFCVVYGLLPTIARVSVICGINPHYLMMSATLASSLPFHLVTGAGVNAMVCAYVHIPPWRMMYAGLGPSLIAIIVVWLTVAVWSTAIWTDITLDPDWSDVNVFQIFRKG
ncbi:protein I'm not dead yet-like isoform X2 [Trichoplusia ni]|nr:protein I'm not dead yet-like isoform X2 [Trichoplusia ni]